MNELLSLFNIANIDDNQIGHLMWVLNSPSYTDVFRPYLINIRDTANRMMLDRSQKRKDELNDDFLAGQITAIEGLLTLFDRLINETNFERIRESQEPRSDEQEYASALAAGQIRGSGVNVADEYRPEDDL